MTPEKPRRRAGDGLESEYSDLADKVGDDTRDRILLEVWHANRKGTPITVWDLPQATGLPLQAAFAAARKLESDRLIAIGDSPSDPFGATLRIRKEALPRLPAPPRPRSVI
ncbi:hypothetical protein [Erythrobacter aureus]|uniref:hypothetical protein n=1 Tax=Erythrobacter aureus TaxID=2182384 RepID=UPI003A8C96B2